MSRYRHEVPLDLTSPLPTSVMGEGPLEPEAAIRRPLHKAGCWCEECWNAGLRYGEYLKTKRLEGL